MKAVFVTGGSGFVGRHLLPALRARGLEVRALARSEAAQAEVRRSGADPVPGDLLDREALRRGMQGCDTVFHLAACTEEWAPWETFLRGNVQGTQAVLDAARAAGVGRVVHFGTEAVFVDGHTRLSGMDETWPLPERPLGHYPASKALAERAVLASGLDVVVVRPRLIWGRGDSTLLPKIAEKVRSGGWAWIGGGRFPTSTCHVRNAVAGALAAAERGAPGGVYFLTDGPPVEMRGFLTDLLRTQGLEPQDRALPFRLALAAATLCEWVWRVLRRKGTPPLTKVAVLLAGQEVTVDDSRARREIGYAPPVTLEEGLAEMRATS